MPIHYVNFEEARQAGGLRMVVVPGVPSPWGESAKGILHVKKIPWMGVHLDYANPEIAKWTGEQGGPVAMYNDEAPRSGWAAILLLAEHLAPTPALLPRDPKQRTLVFGLAHEICGEQGLGWARRLQGVHAGLQGEPGFSPEVAGYLAAKYGYRPESAAANQLRVIELLNMLSARLKAQKESGSCYYVGETLTAVDIYSATFMALFAPLPPEHCKLSDAMRTTFCAMDDETRAALDPSLLEHRDLIYSEHLELPLSL